MKRALLLLLSLSTIPAYAPPSLVIALPVNGYALVLSHDNKYAAMIQTSDEHVVVYDLTTGKLAYDLNVGTGGKSLVFAPNGKEIVVGYWSGDIHVYDLASKLKLTQFNHHRLSITQLEFIFEPNSGTLYLGSLGEDGRLKIWNYQAPRNPLIHDLTIGMAEVFRFNPNGQLVAALDGPNVRLWNLSNGKEITRGASVFFTVTQYWDAQTIGFSGTDVFVISRGLFAAYEMWRIALSNGTVHATHDLSQLHSSMPFDMPGLKHTQFSLDGSVALSPNSNSYRRTDLCLHHFALATIPTYQPLRSGRQVTVHESMISRDGRRGATVTAVAGSTPVQFRLEVWDL